MRSLTDSATEEGDLSNFADAAAKAFAFLLQMGFTLTRQEAKSLRYEGGGVFVLVFHGRSSHLVGLELGRIDGYRYSLFEVLSAMAPSAVERARRQTNDPAALEQYLKDIAETMQSDCVQLLRADPQVFEKLETAVRPMRQAATLQAQFGATLDQADQAWEGKDYRRAAALYQEAAQALDEMRRRRLEYLLSRPK